MPTMVIQLLEARSAEHDLRNVFRSHQDSDRTLPVSYPELAPAFAHDLPGPSYLSMTDRSTQAVISAKDNDMSL